MLDKTVCDDDKESYTRHAAIEGSKSFFKLIFKLIVLIVATICPLLIVIDAGLISSKEMFKLATNPITIITTVIVFMMAWLIRKT